MTTWLSFYRPKKRTKPAVVVPEPAPAVEAPPPPCPHCGSEGAWLQESPWPCCRAYRRALDQCDD
jgi:hypothetical protein